MADTDFSQWDPPQTNMESDSAYQGDSQRSGGATTGSIFASLLANKFFYQVSTFIRAMALTLVNKGYSPKDGTSPYQADTSSNAAVTALASVLSNLLTNADVIQSISISTTSGHIKFGSAFSNLQLQWGVLGPLTGSTTITGAAITFPVPFTQAPGVILTPGNANTNYVGVQVYFGGTTVDVGYSTFVAGAGNNGYVNWFAIGN